MRFAPLAATVASLGVASAAAIKPKDTALRARDTCSDVEFTGEVLHLSLNIIEYPVVVDVQLEEDAIITVDNTILIEATNAPTHLHTTVMATSTSTVTKTISTATITAAAAGEATAGSGSGSSNSGSGSTGSSSGSGSSGVVAGSGSSGSSGSGSGSGSSNNGSPVVVTKINPKTTNTRLIHPQVTGSKSLAPVAGGSAVGSGVNTALYTASTSNTLVGTKTTTIRGASTTATRTYTTTLASITATQAAGEFTDWRKFKANGVNLGGWLEQEQVFDQVWWDSYAPNATDEWTFCKTLGSQCGPVLEERYATYITTDDIDRVAAVGVNTLRIPTTYAAWIQVPGSQLYHGNQQTYLRNIATYAIEKYNMRVIIGLHSLPGGVNSLDIGEAAGHDGWFFNTTNLQYSYSAVSAVVDFIASTGTNAWAFTLAPLNEASDNPAGFASPETLTDNGTAWIVQYTKGVLERIAASAVPDVPVMLQDCFLGEEHWSGHFDAAANLVFDTHVYYFAASGVYSQWAQGAICGQASVLGGDGKFPVFVGEWALQTLYSNTYANRRTLFETQRYAWSYYVQGGSFWNIKHKSTAKVDGQGTQQDYWSYELLLDEGVIGPIKSNATYC